MLKIIFRVVLVLGLVAAGYFIFTGKRITEEISNPSTVPGGGEFMEDSFPRQGAVQSDDEVSRGGGLFQDIIDAVTGRWERPAQPSDMAGETSAEEGNDEAKAESEPYNAVKFEQFTARCLPVPEPICSDADCFTLLDDSGKTVGYCTIEGQGGN